MTLTASYPLNANTFAGIPSIQAMGTSMTGDAAPNGVPNAYFFENGVAKFTINQNDPPTFTGIRTEMVFVPAALNDEVWYTWEFMLGQDFSDNLGQIVIMQIHPEDSLLTAVDFSLHVKDGCFCVTYPLAEPPTIGSSSFLFNVGSVVYNTWVKCSFRAVWKNTPTGMFQFEMFDRVFTASVSNRGTAYNADTPYLKMGVYDGPHAANFGTKSIYIRNINIWSGNDGNQAVTGGVPMPRTRVVQG